MMKKIVAVIISLFACSLVFAQNPQTKKYIDSLKNELRNVRNDTTHVLIMADLCSVFQFTNYDSLGTYSEPALALARRIKFARGEARLLAYQGNGLALQGNVPKALELLFKALQIAQEKHYEFETAVSLANIGNSYWYLSDFPKTITYSKSASKIIEQLPKDHGTAELSILTDANIGECYTQMNKLDSAFYYLQRSYTASINDQFWHPALLMWFGELQFKMGNYQKGLTFLRQSIAINEKNNHQLTNADACRIIAGFFEKTGQPDSSLYYLKHALAAAQVVNYKLGILNISKSLAEHYEHTDISQSYNYLKMAMAVNDDLFGAKKIIELQKTLSDEQQRQREAEAERVAHQARLNQYAFFGGLAILIVSAFAFYRSKKEVKKRNAQIQKTL